MTDLRQAAQQALEFLESGNFVYPTKLAVDLRTALEQQQAEPVALWQKRHPLRTEGAWKNTNEHDAKWWSEKAQGWEIRALYTTPPQRKELSEIQILDMMPSAIPAEYDGELMEFARAIEAKLKERNGY